MMDGHRMRIVMLILVLMIPTVAHEAACDLEAERAFDFWLGDWEIGQKFRAGDDAWIELPAKTSVTKVLDGCALLERWEGQVQYPWRQMTEPERLEGLSLRYFLPDENVWRILWMDTMNPSLGDGYFGTIDDGYGEFEPRPKPDSGRWSKIVFDRKGPDHVLWHLDFTSDGGETWRTIWIMDMRREGAPEDRAR